MGGIGLPGILLLIILGLLLFGPKKLPELGRALGQTLREFKEGAAGVMKSTEQEVPQQPTQVQQAAPDTTVEQAKNVQEVNKNLPE